MKYLVRVLTVLIFTVNFSNVYAADFLYKWKTNLDPVKAERASRLLDRFNIQLKNNKGIVKLSSRVAKALSKTNAFEYLEEDKIVKAPVIDTPKEDIETKINTEKSNNKFFWRWRRRSSNNNSNSNSLNTNKGWHLDKVGARKAWDITEGDSSVIVAFCDSGINKSRSEFNGKVLTGWNFIGRNTNTYHYSRYGRANTHGSSVAAFIAAEYNSQNENGGVAPGISLLPGLITNASGSTSTSRIIDCIEWATNKGAKVINVSITGSNSSAGRSAAREAFKKGSLVVWSSGNQNQRLAAGELDEMLVVGGTDSVDARYLSGSYGSNYGPSLDVVAPGEGVHIPWGTHPKSNGTSYSAPIVSGVAALIFSYDQSLTPAEVVEVMQLTAKPLGDSEYFGAGLVDAAAAIEFLRESRD